MTDDEHRQLVDDVGRLKESLRIALSVAIVAQCMSIVVIGAVGGPFVAVVSALIAVLAFLFAVIYSRTNGSS